MPKCDFNKVEYYSRVLRTIHRILISCFENNSKIEITVGRGVSRITKQLSPN